MAAHSHRHFNIISPSWTHELSCKCASCASSWSVRRCWSSNNSLPWHVVKQLGLEVPIEKPHSISPISLHNSVTKRIKTSGRYFWYLLISFDNWYWFHLVPTYGTCVGRCHSFGTPTFQGLGRLCHCGSMLRCFLETKKPRHGRGWPNCFVWKFEQFLSCDIEARRLLISCFWVAAAWSASSGSTSSFTRELFRAMSMMQHPDLTFSLLCSTFHNYPRWTTH